VGATNCLGVDHDLERGVQPGELHNLFDEVIHQINTDIRHSRIEGIREGYRAIVADRRPVVGATGVPGLSVATGTYRNGILIAPLVAEIVAREITGNESGENPFQVARELDCPDLALLSDIGIRDIVSFLHEPRGALPYDRANELRKYVMALFQMAILDDARYADLRTEIRQRLEEAPFNETMHKLFYEIVAQADVAQVDAPAERARRVG
jgi:glycine oxidase